MIYIVSKEKEYIYSVEDGFKVYTSDEVIKIENDVKQIIWEACDKDLFNFRVCINEDNESCSILSTYTSIYDYISSCCLLEELTIITRIEYKRDFEYMLQDFSDLKTELKIIEPIQYTDKPLYLSVKPCVTRIPDKIENISLAYHNLDKLKRHEILALKDKFDSMGKNIVCMNGLLTQKENMFYNTNSFYDKIVKIVAVSQLLGVKYIIFGSPLSRLIQNIERTLLYAHYEKCHREFVRKIQEIGLYIIEKEQVIIIKPNKNSNSINSEEIVDSLVNSINLDNVILGPMRTSIINHHRDFDLLEYIGCNDDIMYQLLSVKL